MMAYNPVQCQTVRLQQVLRLPGVLPPPCNLRVADLVSMSNQIIVRIGDLKLPPCTRLNIIYSLKYSGVINIDAGYSILTFGHRWLFFNPDNLPILNFRHTKTLRVMYPGQYKMTV